MARYAVLIFEQETPNGVADIPPEVMRAHLDLPEPGPARPDRRRGRSGRRGAGVRADLDVDLHPG